MFLNLGYLVAGKFQKGLMRTADSEFVATTEDHYGQLTSRHWIWLSPVSQVGLINHNSRYTGMFKTYSLKLSRMKAITQSLNLLLAFMAMTLILSCWKLSWKYTFKEKADISNVVLSEVIEFFKALTPAQKTYCVKCVLCLDFS